MDIRLQASPSISVQWLTQHISMQTCCRLTQVACSLLWIEGKAPCFSRHHMPKSLHGRTEAHTGSSIFRCATNSSRNFFSLVQSRQRILFGIHVYVQHMKQGAHSYRQVPV